MRTESRLEKIMRTYKDSMPEEGKVVMEAKKRGNIFEGRTLRVCAYCRVSTGNEEQQSSFELQQEHYQKLVGKYPNWILKTIYADEGISGTSLKKRDDFNRMIAACKAGEYDLIITKSVSRFARNLVDCVKLVRELKAQSSPVGVYFETDGLNTLSEDSELKLSILATFAQEESIKKSESMVWSIRERFKTKKLLTPAPYGYERPRDQVGKYIKYAQLQVVEDEAKIVRLIFDAFLAGYSPTSIANLLTDANIPTKSGSAAWNVSAIHYILSNERYCGCVLTWKTFTADIFEHTKRKTTDEREQIFYHNTHEAIVPLEKFEAAQALLADRRQGFRGGTPILHVIDTGIFSGYLPINHRWINEDPLPYFQASQVADNAPGSSHRIKKSYYSAFNLSGYQVLRGAFINSRGDRPVLSITDQKISFNSYCLKKFSDVPFIQLLLHPTKRRIAIRPCGEKDTYRIHWKSTYAINPNSKTLSCPHFSAALFSIMGWNPDFSYKVLGSWLCQNDDQIIFFDLKNSLPVIEVDDDEEMGDKKHRKRRVSVCPEEWETSFGEEFYTYSTNTLYYNLSRYDWKTNEKSHAVQGQTDYDLMSTEEIENFFDELKQTGGFHNANV